MALDNFRRTNITLNRANQPVLEPQITKVGDVNGRELVVQIVDGDVIKDQTGVVLKLNWQHANGNQGSETFNPLDAKQGLFSVYYPENMLFRGTVTANISINEDGKITNSLNFQIAVKGDVFDESAVEVDGLLFTLKDLKDQLDERDNNLDSLENRQTSVETQFNSLQQEITDKDITSAPEIIAARGGEPTLSERLDKQLAPIAPKNGAYVKVNDIGNVEFMSSIDPTWENWANDKYRYGLSPQVTPIWHEFLSSIEVDGMITSHSRHGRWNSVDTDLVSSVFVNGGHVFEGWTVDETQRLTMLVGKRPNYADIHFFDNVTKKFEWVKIGSDYENTAFDFSKDEAKFYGYVSMGSNSGIKKTFANRDLEITGGDLFGQERNGAGIRLFGEGVVGASKGNAEIFIGSYGTDIDNAAFQIKHMYPDGVKDLLKIKADGELISYGKSTFLDALRLARVDMGTFEGYGAGQKSGQMVYDEVNNKVKVNINGTWKSVVVED